MGVCVGGGQWDHPPPPAHHLPRLGIAGPGTDQSTGEAGSRNWDGGDARPSSVLAQPPPLPVPSLRQYSVHSSSRAFYPFRPFSPPPARAPRHLPSMARLSLSVPGLAPAAAGPAGKGLRQGRCLDGTGRRKGGGTAGEGARRPGLGARGAHRRRPSAGRPPLAWWRRRRSRAVPTPPGILAPEKPGSPGWEEEVLGDSPPRAYLAPGRRTRGAAGRCLGHYETRDGGPLEVKTPSSRASAGRSRGQPKDPPPPSPPASSTHNFPAFHLGLAERPADLDAG